MTTSSRTKTFHAKFNIDRRFRMRHSICLIVALVCFFGPLASRLKAQNFLEDLGIPDYTRPLPIENGIINAANGTVHLSIPLGSWPQRGGGQFTANLTYDSHGAWKLLTSADPGWAGPDGGYDGITCPSDGQAEDFVDTPFYWMAPDMTERTFNITIKEPVVTNCGSGVSVPTGSQYATDGSGYFMVVTNYGDATVYAPDGTQVYPSVKDSNGNEYTMSGTAPSITDLGGTYYSGTYSPVYFYTSLSFGANYTDSLGRAIVTVSLSGNNFYFDVLNSQGNTSRYTVVTSTVPFCPGPSWYVGPSRSVKEVDLPDGTKYSFTYDGDFSGTDCSSSIWHYGDITSMKLPTNGQINYVFSTQRGTPYQFPVWSRWISTRTTPDSSTPWTYTPSWDSTTCGSNVPDGCQQTMTVAKPNTDTDTYTFNIEGSPWETQRQFYSGSTSGTLLATISEAWLYGWGIDCLGPICHALLSSVTTTLPVPGGTSINQTSKYTWEATGIPTQRSDWNFYTGSLPSTADKTTNYTYLSYLGLINRPLTVIVTNASGATVSKTVNCYDYASGCGGSAFSNAGTVVNHDSTFGTTYTTRGDLTQVERLVSGTSNYLVKSMTYDTAGSLHSETDWSNANPTTYDYTDHYVDDNLSNTEPLTTHSTSTATDAYPTTVTAPVSALSMTYKYYYGTGQKSSATDQNSKTAYWHFGDSLSRPTSTKSPNSYNGSCCGWTFDVYPSASETQVDTAIGITSTTLSTSCSASAGDCRHDQTLLDPMGRTSSKILVSDPDGQRTAGTTYDSNGRVSTVTNPYRSGTLLPTDGTESYAYDGLDRKTQVTRSDLSVARTYYGAAVSTYGGRSSQLCSGYGVGYPILSIDEAARLRQTWTDGFGRLIEVDEPDPSTGSLTSGSYAKTCYAYDLNNNLIGVLQPGNEATCTVNSVTYNRCFTYDLISRLTAATNPESGAINYYYTTSGSSLCSGDLSEVCRRTDARSITTTYAYDAATRLKSKSYSDSTPAVQYGYDGVALTGCSTTTPSLTITNGNGRRTSMCDGAGATTWSFDEVGNALIEKRTTVGTSNVTDPFTYVYNLDSTVATVNYPSGRTITYAPGGAQLPFSAKDITNSINYATSAHYFPPGELGSVTNGSSINFTAITNNRLQPCWQYATTGTALLWNSTLCTASESTSGNILDLEYSLNFGSSDNGNVMTITNNRDSTRGQAFNYDFLNRIGTAKTTSTHATSPGNCWGEAYTIDPVGNLTAIAAVSDSNYIGCSQESGFNLTSSLNSHNQFGGWCYDASGNKVGESSGSCSPPPTTYAYNAENQLTSTAGVTYYYDGDGKRVRKSNGTLYWYGTNSDPLLETDESGTTPKEYIFFGGKRIASRDSSGAVLYYFADDLESSRVVTNDSGTIKDDIDFYPYGGERAVVGPSSGNHYLFTGKERDSESGLDNFGARYMSSQYGRFMTPDSTGYSSLANPQAWNLYAYTLNNPLKYKDPSGHTVECGSDAQKCQAAIAASTANAEAAKRVTLQSTPHSFLGLFHWTTNTIQIAGDINSFRELGQNASRLADLVTDSRTIKFGVASSYSENAISLWGKLNDASSKELNNGGQSLLPSEDQNPAAYVNSDPSSADSEARKEGIPGANLGETTAHELLGHVWGELVGGHPAYPPGTENGALNKRDAVNSENAVRATDPSRGQKQNHD